MADLVSTVREALDDLVSFDGHNNFSGAGGPEMAKTTIAALVRSEPVIDLDAVERYLRKKVLRKSQRRAEFRC
jgi:hypothetical protein